MLIRFGFLVAASIAAFTIKQITINSSKPPSTFVKPSDTGDENLKHCNGEEREKNILKESKNTTEKEKVEDVLITTDNVDCDHFSLHNDFQLTNNIQNNDDRSELECLRRLVNELEETQDNLSTQLLVYYGLKEQKMEIVQLKDQLNAKRIELNKLSMTKNYLKADNKKLQEQIAQAVVIRTQLEKARLEIRNLEQKFHMNLNQRDGIVVMLKQQAESIPTDQHLNNDIEIQKKLKTGTSLELEIMELKRRHKELQLEKRILAIKLVVTEARIASAFNTTESEVLKKKRTEGEVLRLANENLLKQMEELQKDRFNAVEELVYQRWVNACLRYEKNQQTETRKNSNCELKPVSGPCSSTESNDSYNPLEVRCSSEKKRSLMHKLKRWRRSLDNFSVSSSISKSFGSSSRETKSSSESTRSRRSSFSVSSFGGSTLKNIRNRVSFTASVPVRRRVSFNDSLSTRVIGMDDEYVTDVECEKLVFEIDKPIGESGSDIRSILKGSGVKSETEETQSTETIEVGSEITNAAPTISRSSDMDLNNVQLDLGLLRFDAIFLVIVMVVVYLYILCLNVHIF